MSAVIHSSSTPAETVNASATRNMGLNQNSDAGSTGTEANRKTIYRNGGLLTNLAIKVLTNDRAASTFRSRNGTSNGAQLASIGASTTGWIEDVSNTDTVSAGEDWHAQLITGAGGTTFTYNIVQVTYDPASDTVHKISGSAPVTFATASTTAFGGFFGDNVITTTEDNAEITYRTNATLRNLYVRISANSRTTTTTIGSRVNGANGNLSVSIGSTATGDFEDTSNSDTVTANQTVNWRITTGTGTQNITVASVAVDVITTNRQYQYTAGDVDGITQASAISNFYPVCGNSTGGTTEGNFQSEANLAYTASRLQINVTANTETNDATLRFRKNGNNGNQVVTITASTTGIFEDASNNDSVVATDLVNYSLVTGAGAASLTYRAISMLAERPATTLFPQKMMMGLGV